MNKDLSDMTESQKEALVKIEGFLKCNNWEDDFRAAYHKSLYPIIEGYRIASVRSESEARGVPVYMAA